MIEPNGFKYGVCPQCGKVVTYDDTALWLYQDKFYCSEQCVALRQGRLKP